MASLVVVQGPGEGSYFPFVERLVDPKRRRNLVLSVGRVWAGQSPEQARAYFQTSTWDANIRNRFL